MTLQEYLESENGVSQAEQSALATLATRPELVRCLTAWAEALSETCRVAAISSSGNESIESLGRWKAFQTYADFVRNRVADYKFFVEEFNRNGGK